MTPGQWAAEIRRALARLAASPGRPVARRNARAAMARAVRGLRLAVGREYPYLAQPKRASARPRKRLSPSLRVEALQAAGWRAPFGVMMLGALAQAKVPAKVIRTPDAWSKTVSTLTLVPGWAVDLYVAGVRGAELARLVRHPAERRYKLSVLSLAKFGAP